MGLSQIIFLAVLVGVFVFIIYRNWDGITGLFNRKSKNGKTNKAQ
jgi:hypothetical protein